MAKVFNFFTNIVLFCLVLALLVCGAEAALRISGVEPDSYVTPEIYGNVNLLYRPNGSTRWRGNLGQVSEFDAPITVNSQAMHDREHQVKKPAGVYRVLVVGDSYVEAFQVPLEKGFPSLLEEALNRDPEVARSGRRVEIIKLAGSGHGALREFELMTTLGWKYSPDLVLTFVTDSNDFKDDWHYFRRRTGLEEYKHPNLRPSGALYEKNAFYGRLLWFPQSRLNRWIAFNLTQLREKRRQEKQDADGWKETLGIYALPGSPWFAAEAAKWDEAFRLTATAHLKMKQESATRGAAYAVVFNDRVQTYRPGAYRYLFKILPGLDKEVDLDRPTKALKVLFNGQSVDWFDLNDVFKKKTTETGRTGHYRYDGHWNAEGHQWTADALVPLVKEKILYEAQKTKF